jgi:cyclomaltodextrinase
MRMKRRVLAGAILSVLLLSPGWAQDSVDVTFRYLAPGRTDVSVPGEFNGWEPANGRMTDIGAGLWVRTVRLRIGGNPNPPAVGVPGAWQYKFWYSGVSDWPNDPLNHHVNPRDNNNSYLRVNDPTIYHLLPNQRAPLVNTNSPTISAFLYPKVGSLVDTASLQLSIDGVIYSGIGSSYDFAMQQLSFVPPPLPDGPHTVILNAGTNADTVQFSTTAGFVRITTQGGYATRNQTRQIRGNVGDQSLTQVQIVQNATDTLAVAVTGGAFSTVLTLDEGVNSVIALADSNGTLVRSREVNFTYLVNHAPYAVVQARAEGSEFFLDASGSTDPDGQTLTDFEWFDDPSQPLGLSGMTGSEVTIPKLASPGEYYFGLIVRDPDGNADTTRAYFIVNPNRTIANPTYASNPAWAKQARVYFLFPKAASVTGTINAAAQRLPYIKDLGFNVVWVMPVMKTAFPIDLNYNVGYNIVDFYNVAPEYGTNQDFRNFVNDAHALGLKVILDVTPNHTSRFHPWSEDAHLYKEDSRYWTWYEHQEIPHNTNNLNNCLDDDGFNYYCGFTSQLLNYNWRDVDARAEMINVYKYWIQEFGLDGYRFDVYWGPHRRYGEQYMGNPVREALKHVKPDILLLGEDDGTGVGTETIYADYQSGGIGSGLDASYDFKLYFNQIRSFAFASYAINSLHAEIDNAGFYPGENALYMRFMESQDEDRIVYFYSNNFTLDATYTFKRTMPIASVLFTAPGFPMIWNGQEVGWGYGITGPKEARIRSIINWDYQGKDLLSPHYQVLAHIRAQFPAFTQHKKDTNGDGSVTSADVSDFVRVSSTNGDVYAFTRPYQDQNGLTVVNIAETDQQTVLNLTGTTMLAFQGGLQPGEQVYLNNLYANTRVQVAAEELDSLVVSLPAFGSAIYTVSRTPDSLVIPNPIVDVRPDESLPEVYDLEQNFPNPFNPTTVIRFQLARAGAASLKVYDILGREVVTLVEKELTAGTHDVTWNGRNAAGTDVGTGVYFYRLEAAGDNGQHIVFTRKLVLVR